MMERTINASLNDPLFTLPIPDAYRYAFYPTALVTLAAAIYWALNGKRQVGFWATMPYWMLSVWLFIKAGCMLMIAQGRDQCILYCALVFPFGAIGLLWTAFASATQHRKIAESVSVDLATPKEVLTGVFEAFRADPIETTCRAKSHKPVSA